MSTLLVVPVRSGSRGLPRKALRLLNGKPPLAYTLAVAHGLGDVLVVTDSAAIGTIAQDAGVPVVDVRTVPAFADLVADGLLDGTKTWEPAVARAVWHWERASGVSYTSVAVLQCTSPFLRRTTVQRCLAALAGYVVALTVKDDRHARIGTPRMPRELMPPCWKVTGGCTAIRRADLVETAWPVEHGMPIVVEGAEAVDLDTPEDWAVAEMYAGMTEREHLLARLLSPGPAHGQAVILSAWDESGEDWPRFQVAPGAGAVSYHGAHTRDEAEKAVDHRSGNDLTIVTSAYHLPRAFLTFVRVLQDRGLAARVRLWPAPAPSAMAQLAGEWAKIAAYQAKGDVASYEDGLRYLDWRDCLPVAAWSGGVPCVT